MKEIWKPVKGYEGLYEVSSLGRVKSLARKTKIINVYGECYINLKERILKQRTTTKGYLDVALYKNGKYKTKKVHRLVAETFIPNPNNLPQVNHINGIKTDNSAENLEFCTNQENITHAIKIGLRKKKRNEILNEQI